MILYDILQPVFVLLLMAFLISQCLIPEITDRPWFPLFRRVWKVPGKISAVKEKIAERKLDSELAKLEKETRCPIHR